MPPKRSMEDVTTEFVYGSEHWGKKNNSCYAYALDKFRSRGNSKLQPGQLAKTNKKTDDLTDPKTLRKRVLEDLATKKNGGYELTSGKKCKPGFYKIMAFVDPGVDFHFYRQVSGHLITKTDGKSINTISKNTGVSKNKINAPSDNIVILKNSGLWKHKRGLSVFTTKDASGKFIKDPKTADRNYGELNYKIYVGTFCVNNDFGVGEPISCVYVKKKLTYP